MSYEILKGITLLKGKSLAHFTDILEDTLAREYNISCARHTFGKDPQEVQCEPKEKRNDFVQWIKEQKEEDLLNHYVIKQSAFEEIEAKYQAGKGLKTGERVRRDVYKYFVKLWGIDTRDISKELLVKHAGVLMDNKIELMKEYEAYFKAIGLQRVMKKSLPDLQAMFKYKMSEYTDLRKNKDGNNDIDNSVHKRSFQMCIEAKSMLNHVINTAQLEQGQIVMKEEGQIVMKEEDFKKGVEAYIKGLSEEQFKNVRKLFDLKAARYKDKKDALDKLTWFANAVLKDGAAIESDVEWTNKNPNREGYGTDGKRTLSIKKYIDFIDKYKPMNFNLGRREMDFVEVEDEYEDWL